MKTLNCSEISRVTGGHVFGGHFNIGSPTAYGDGAVTDVINGGTVRSRDLNIGQQLAAYNAANPDIDRATNYNDFFML